MLSHHLLVTVWSKTITRLFPPGWASGLISLRHWASATETVLKLGLPWRVLRPQLVSSTKHGMVNYHQWIKELSITEPKLEVSFVLLILLCCLSHSQSCNNILHVSFLLQISDTSILETMYKNHSNLETIFRIIDTDHSGE